MKDQYQQLIWYKVMGLLLLLALLLAAGLFSLSRGAADISFADAYRIVFQRLRGSGELLDTRAAGIVFQLRLPRVLLAAMTGFALGISGAVMQSIMHNPLASPYTLGISSGAALGAALAIITGGFLFNFTGSTAVIIGAFMMGLLAIFIINILASLKGGGATLLILAGVALSYLFSSGLSFIQYITDHEQLRDLTLWLMGGVYTARWRDIIFLAPALLLGVSLLLKYAWDINALNAGSEVAANLGIDVRKLRRKTSVLAAFLTSSAIAFTGIIGFVGLVTPHLARMVFGNDSRYLMPAAGLLGGSFLVGADIISRMIISPAEMPVGIITSGVGAPFFLYMLVRRRRKYWL